MKTPVCGGLIDGWGRCRDCWHIDSTKQKGDLCTQSIPCQGCGEPSVYGVREGRRGYLWRFCHRCAPRSVRQIAGIRALEVQP